KTEVPREVPVHPELARILAAWKLEHYPLIHGVRPGPDDLLVRNSYGRMYTRSGVIQMLHKDLEAIGLRRRRVHDFRRTLITLARADGARPDLLKFVTHGASTSMIDVYTTPTWASLCEQIACLQVAVRAGNVVELRKN